MGTGLQRHLPGPERPSRQHGKWTALLNDWLQLLKVIASSSGAWAADLSCLAREGTVNLSNGYSGKILETCVVRSWAQKLELGGMGGNGQGGNAPLRGSISQAAKRSE